MPTELTQSNDLDNIKILNALKFSTFSPDPNKGYNIAILNGNQI